MPEPLISFKASFGDFTRDNSLSPRPKTMAQEERPPCSPEQSLFCMGR